MAQVEEEYECPVMSKWGKALGDIREVGKYNRKIWFAAAP
jgi:hypothetical protein